MNIVTRFQNFLAKIAGRDIDLDGLKPPGGYNTDEQLLLEIAERLDGAQFPEVTKTDDGDVLTVVDGKWNKAAPSGGSDLPSVTAADNGDVLTVVDGAWDKAAPSGGTLVVTMSGDPLTSDKTWQEIYDALAARKEVVLVMGVDTEEQKIQFRDPVLRASYPDENGGVNPYGIDTQSAALYVASADDYLSMA